MTLQDPCEAMLSSSSAYSRVMGLQDWAASTARAGSTAGLIFSLLYSGCCTRVSSRLTSRPLPRPLPRPPGLRGFLTSPPRPEVLPVMWSWGGRSPLAGSLKEPSESPVGFWTCRANLVLFDTARLVPLRADWGTVGRPPGTCRVAELTVEAGEARLEARVEARVATEGGDSRPVVELDRTILLLSISLSNHSYFAPVLTTPPTTPPATPPATPPGAPPDVLLEAWSVPGEPFSFWPPPPLVCRRQNH